MVVGEQGAVVCGFGSRGCVLLCERIAARVLRRMSACTDFGKDENVEVSWARVKRDLRSRWYMYIQTKRY
jgi:hypothetical protein